MENSLLIAVLAGLAGMIGWGLADFFAKKTIDVVGDVASLAWAGVFGTIALLGWAAYIALTHGYMLTFPLSPATWILLIFFGALQAAVYLFAYNGFGKGQIAVLNPVFASFAGLTAILSIIFFGESVSPLRLVALGLIFIGILALSLNLEKLHSHRINFAQTPGLWEVGIATVLAAIWTVLWNQFVSGNDWLGYAIYMFAFMTISVFVAALGMRKSLKVRVGSMWKFLVLIGLCEIIAYIGISWGYGVTTETSVIAILSGAFSLPTIILARLFLGEKPNRAQTIGSLLVIAGIVALPLV